MTAWIVTVTERYMVEAGSAEEAADRLHSHGGRLLDMETHAEEEYAYSARDTQQYYQDKG